MNYIDVMVTLVSLVEFLSFWALLADSNVNVNPVLFRLLRIGKMARAIRMVTMNSVLQSLQILTRCLVSSTNMLFWTFCLLTFFQCVAGMVAATLCRGFLEDESQDLGLRNEVFKYYGTFSRTILTMFEILFANWSPPCRVLVENISEYFSIFFLVYRCIIGFAVLNVVGAVFVQQTMKIASTDEQLAFKQKERELASYTRKVKKLFQTMDVSGDGTINFEEFSKLVQSPMLQFLLSQLDLEYHDLLSLFEFLDNGDGQITLAEFIDGAAKLRGNAKALDIWRIETKIEVFFGEVLAALRVETNVQQAFEQHNFKNVTLITESRRTVVFAELRAFDDFSCQRQRRRKVRIVDCNAEGDVLRQDRMKNCLYRPFTRVARRARGAFKDAPGASGKVEVSIAAPAEAAAPEKEAEVGAELAAAAIQEAQAPRQVEVVQKAKAERLPRITQKVKKAYVRWAEDGRRVYVNSEGRQVSPWKGYSSESSAQMNGQPKAVGA
ncbi:unnamed protein product [Effrenium voratum]|nr:unnamed protein product [Effrenium voratum]